ncbi:hypothetical protein HV560_06230 [Mannheimia pernigra]|uniref:Uncharacterized protein n=1 Tax=Mannheimia pernigra TaxID=111844 RepID=A0ABD7A8E5_9PAST|nr:hypothetical protein [Mannheimia pernigra]QLB42438.1 hypothetical protein HV560_06230 [Mannheimia pernigra]
MSTAQAEKFTNIYDIIAHKLNTSNGYSGTIVKNKKTNEMFVLHRGTEIKTGADWLEDGILGYNRITLSSINGCQSFC